MAITVYKSTNARAHAGFETPATGSEDIKTHYPPISNTGGKQERKNQSRKKDIDKTGLVDYLTIVIPDEHFKPEGWYEDDELQGKEFDHDLFIDAVNKIFLSNLGLVAQPKLLGGKNFYSHSWEITDLTNVNTVGFVAHGNNKNTLCISISGAGTALIGSAGFIFTRNWLVEQGGHITRVDVAHDCFKGEKTVSDAISWFQMGVFRSGKNGVQPLAKLIDDFESGQGKTLYIGSRKSGKLMRVYEKGKQLGDPNSPWVRWELELRSIDRHISPDILIMAGDFLSGSYECMDWVSDEQSYVKTQSKSAQVTYKHLEDYCRLSYGRFINVMFAMYETEEQIVKAILRDDGFPRRLNHMKIKARD